MGKITVKQYAEERGITIQAVHKSLNGKQKKEQLKGHVETIDGVKWLDEVAVEILDRSRQKSPVVIEREDSSERILELENEIKILLAKNSDQANRIAELAEWKAEKSVAIAEANQKLQLMADYEKKIEKLESDVSELENQKKELQQLNTDVARKVEELKSRSLFQRIFRKGE